MYRKLAAAAVLVGMSVGSVAHGADRWGEVAIDREIPRLYPQDARSVIGNPYDSPGDDTFKAPSESWYPRPNLYDSPGDDTFFDVFMEKRIIDDGDARFTPHDRPVIDNGEPGYNMAEALWFELLGR